MLDTEYDYKLVHCPVCNAMNLLSPGAPSYEPRNFYNRCSALPLAGERGKGAVYHCWFEHSYRKPERATGGFCGAPFTDSTGALIPLLSQEEYRLIVASHLRETFDPREVWERVAALLPLKERVKFLMLAPQPQRSR